MKSKTLQRAIFLSILLGVIEKQASASFLCGPYKELSQAKRFAALHSTTYPWK